jgi:tetratricopeptide (TPR) repeat protein
LPSRKQTRGHAPAHAPGRGGTTTASPGAAHRANERGIALARGGRWAEALAAFEAALVAGGPDPSLHHNRALARFALGHSAGAAADLEAAWRAGDRRPLVLANRASALLAARRYRRAEEACDQALEAAPPSRHRELAAVLFAERGVARASQGALEDALADFARAGRLTRDRRLRAELARVTALTRAIERA